MKVKSIRKIFASTLMLCCALTAVHVEARQSLSGLDCLIQPNMTVELSSPVAGVIEAINVDRSDTISKGQVLAKLTSDVEQEKYKMALAKAQYQGNLESSNVNLKLSDKEYKRARSLYKDRAIPLAEKDQAEANLELSKYEHDKAIHESDVLSLELNHAKANLELKQIRSPIDGVVVDRYMTPGEYVENKPVLKVAQLHPLRIELISSVDNFGSIRTGMHARVIPEFGNYDDLIAEVVVVDKVIDAASGTFGVRLLLDNVDHTVPGGLKCKLNFFDEQQEVAYGKRKAMQAEADMRSQALLAVAAESTQEIKVNDSSQPADEVSQCATLAGWKDKDKLQQTLSDMAELIVDKTIKEQRQTVTKWLVTTDQLESARQAAEMMSAMEADGVKDIAVMRNGKKVRLSLGLFSKEKRALKRQDKLKAIDYPVLVQPFKRTQTLYSAEIRLTNGTKLDNLEALMGDKDRASLHACAMAGSINGDNAKLLSENH